MYVDWSSETYLKIESGTKATLKLYKICEDVFYAGDIWHMGNT